MDGRRKTDGGKIIWARGTCPVGEVYLALGRRGLKELLINPRPVGDDAAFARRLVRDGYEPVEDKGPLKEAFKWLGGYFSGLIAPFPLPLDPDGTGFEKSVWKAIAAIPRGEVRTYGTIAESIGRPKASRAVGGACGRNPIPVIIPCHRVVASGGPGGYTGGLRIKRVLLAIEGFNL